jgi:hypothetical protein
LEQIYPVDKASARATIFLVLVSGYHFSAALPKQGKSKYAASVIPREDPNRAAKKKQKPKGEKKKTS